MKLPTIKVVRPDNPGEFTIINEADFDPAAHTRWSEAPASNLPEGFPGRDDLAKAGLVDIETVSAVEDLTALDGIGKATAAKITEALASMQAPE